MHETILQPSLEHKRVHSSILYWDFTATDMSLLAAFFFLTYSREFIDIYSIILMQFFHLLKNNQQILQH